ncbi:MAG: arginase family protein [Pseudomonadota bacterium]
MTKIWARLSPEVVLETGHPDGQAAVHHAGGSLQLSPEQTAVLTSPAPPQDDLIARVRYEAARATLLALGVLEPESDDERLAPFFLPEPPLFGASRLSADGGSPSAEAGAAFLGLPWDVAAGPGLGTAVGPAAVRSASQALALPSLKSGWYSFRAQRSFAPRPLLDLGDLGCPALASYTTIGNALKQALADLRQRQLHATPFFIGGDHGLSAAILPALAHPPATLLVLDAHDDFDEQGEPLNHGNWLRHVASGNQVEKILLCGLRGIVPCSRVGALEAHGVEVVSAEAWMRKPDALTARLDRLPPGPVYVSIDIDVVDPSQAPGTPCLSWGGVRPEMLEDLILEVAQRRPLAGVDLMEVAAPRYPHDLTPLMASQILFFAAHAVQR